MVENASGAIIDNKIFMVTVYVWVIAQAIKFILGVFREKRINFRWFIRSGGIPSSHAAGVTAMATACGLQEGFASVAFALAAVFALVIMFDAQGVRRAAGQQAAILNQIVDDIYAHQPIKPEQLFELIGHTPIQVFIGAILGASLALLFYCL